jgi:hypothetical protein
VTRIAQSQLRLEWRDRRAALAEVATTLPIRSKVVIATTVGLVGGLGMALRFLNLRTLPETLGAGIAWGFVSWLFFWYTLLSIARGGAPFHATAASSSYVAPTWVFLVGFAILGVATSLAYRVLRRT